MKPLTRILLTGRVKLRSCTETGDSGCGAAILAARRFPSAAAPDTEPSLRAGRNRWKPASKNRKGPKAVKPRGPFYRLLATSSLLLLATSAFAAPRLQLFNGKDLTGWKMVGPGKFEVQDGMLKTVGGMGLLYYTEKPFGNTTIRVIFKTTGDRDNSGVFIRLPEQPKDPWYGVHNGYEVQIDAAGDEWHSTGALYSLSKVTARNQKPVNEWNTMDIILKGQLTTIVLNGKKINEFRGNQQVPPRKQWYEPIRGPRPDLGYIGLQNHDGRSTIYFKEISVKR